MSANAKGKSGADPYSWPEHPRSTDCAAIHRKSHQAALLVPQHQSAAAPSRRRVHQPGEGIVRRYPHWQLAQPRRQRWHGGQQPSVGLVELPDDHAFANLRLTDNVVQFSTRRYQDNPLIVQGPGAGPEVTAAGVFADLLRVAASLGARV